MKKLIFALLVLPVFLFAQNDAPNMFETTNMKVKRGMEDKFEAAVKAHNEKFHKDSLFEARLGYNVSGPNGGTYTWIMGPTNWSAMDGRPGKGAHDEDWKNVDQYVESYTAPSYWSWSNKLSHMGTAKTEKRLLWAYNIKSGHGARWAELVGKVKQVYEEKLSDEHFWVVWNDMASGKDGTDAIIIFAFENWATLDRQRDFGDLFEEVHGNGSWHTFLNSFSDCVEERVDWTRVMIR